MLKKLIGLGLVFGVATAASALAGGCTTTTTSVDDGGTGTGTDSGHPAATDSGKGGNTDSGPATCPTDTAPTPAELNDPVKGLGWVAPKKSLGACGSADIATLKTNAAASNTYEGLETGLTPACDQCLFTKIDSTDGSAASWQPIVFYTDTTGKVTGVIANPGACFALVENNACGQDVTGLDSCSTIMCADCVDQTSFDTCTADTAVSSACTASFKSDISTACGSGYQNALNSCFGANSKTFIDEFLFQVDVVCGTGGTDGGTDAGPG